MLSPARSDSPLEPDARQGRRRRDGGNRGSGPWWGVLLLGALTALAAIAFPLAPVLQPQVTYSWRAADGAAAIPLMPYQPVELTARTDCATAYASAGPNERVLLSTVPYASGSVRPDPAAQPLSGLRITAVAGALRVESAGVELGTVSLPEGPCALVVVSDAGRTAVLVNDRPALVRNGDVRPDVAGAFSDVPSGVDLALEADTRFQTTISPLKAAIGAVGVLALLGMLTALWRADRAAGGRRIRLLPRRWWAPRPVDAAVTALLGVWWVIGAVTVDDGYIAGIVRSVDSNGFIGNVYRWLNAPEAPFSWFYELYHAWSLISPATLWMRLPSTVLGLLCWWLLSRLVIPRLGPAAARRWTPWLAALAFATWWIPFNLGLRPEPWVAVGALGVFLAVERAVATGRVLPIAVALVLVGATVAVTPGGILALAPLVAAAVPLLRVLRARRDLHLLPLMAALVAAPVSAVYLMVPDQSLAAVLEATRVRTQIGGGMPWYDEYERYALLFASSFQGSIGRRAAVAVTVLAAVGALWALRHTRAGIAAGPARRLVVGLLLSMAAMTFAPTKWTQHFGELAGYGCAVLVLAALTWSTRPLRRRPHAFVAGLAAVTVIGALVLAGRNTWPYVGAWFTPSFSTLPPQVAGVPLATIALVLGGLVVAGLLGRWAWQRAGGQDEPAVPRRLPGPVPLTAVVLAAVLALQVLGLARVAVAHRDSYTLAADAVATMRGAPCGLQETLSVETDPAAGLLPIAAGPPTDRTLPVDVGGRTMPGIAVAGRVTTPWFTLDPQQRGRVLPVVVTTSGTIRPGDGLYLDFGAGDQLLERRPLTPNEPVPRDTRELAPEGATTVRLAVDAPNAARAPAVASLPRMPRLTPMPQLLPPGSRAILDWPVAFVFPCLTPEPLPLGSAGVPQWRVAPPADDPSADITYAPGYGGPFAGPRMLVTEQRMPLYLRGDPVRDPAQLYRWLPIAPLAAPKPVVVDRTVPGWARTGHARIPGLDRVG